MAWANWPVQYKRTIPSLVLLWFNIQFMSQPAIELAVGMGNYWGEPEQAPPSGVAGRMVCLSICLYVPDSQFLCWNSLSKGASACWKICWKCFICPCHLGVSYIIYIPCVLQNTWCAANVQHIHIDRVWCTCWTASLFLCCACVCTFGVSFCGLKCQSHPDDSHVYATTPFVLHVHSLRLAPQCHAFV